jgi:hypothetical protein
MKLSNKKDVQILNINPISERLL